MTPIHPGDPFLYMKVGTHASETLAEIIARKRQEIDEVGFSMWGYGGNTCHPTSMVQPLAREAVEKGTPLVLYMQAMESKHRADRIRAGEYSVDSISWEPIPHGINVYGSRFAICIDSLDSVEQQIDLAKSHVALGLSQGKRGDKYVQGRVDKACLVADDTSVIADRDEHPINLIAQVVAPFAVFVR